MDLKPNPNPNVAYCLIFNLKMFTIRNKGWNFPVQLHVIRWTRSKRSTLIQLPQIQTSAKTAILVESPKIDPMSLLNSQRKIQINYFKKTTKYLRWTDILSSISPKSITWSRAAEEEEAKMKILCGRNKKDSFFSSPLWFLSKTRFRLLWRSKKKSNLLFALSKSLNFTTFIYQKYSRIVLNFFFITNVVLRITKMFY